MIRVVIEAHKLCLLRIIPKFTTWKLKNVLVKKIKKSESVSLPSASRNDVEDLRRGAWAQPEPPREARICVLEAPWKFLQPHFSRGILPLWGQEVPMPTVAELGSKVRQGRIAGSAIS